MDFSKFKNKFLIVLCITFLFLPFYLITFTYASQNITGIVLDGIGYTQSYNTGDVVILTNVSNARGIYFPVKAGYSYVLTGDFIDTQYYRMFTTEVTPAFNVSAVGMYLGYTPNNYTFTATSDGYLFIWNYERAMTNDNTSFTTLGGMTDTVSSLVDNVGISQFWDTFSNAIPMISVCAFFIFGFVIITYLYLKLSKGKAGF